MNLLKKMFLTSIFLLFLITTLSQSQVICSKSNSIQTININYPLKVSVLISSSKIKFFELLSEDMKKVSQENPGTVEYTFYDGKVNQDIQYNQLNDILSEKKTDLLMIDMVDISHTRDFVNIIKENNIPVIFLYNGDPEAIKSYSKAFLAGTDSREAGNIEGDIIVDKWNNYEKDMYKSADSTLNYILLLSTPNSKMSEERAKFAILTIKKNGIKAKELDSRFCYWNESRAREATLQYLLKFDSKIDAIIAIEDSMAIGAVKALQEYGYNLGNKQKTIMVVGCDGIPEALNLVEQGAMTGTVKQDTYEIANALYAFGLNLMSGKNIIEGTNCTIDSSGDIITIPSLKPVVSSN